MKYAIITLILYCLWLGSSIVQADVSATDKEVCRSYVMMFCTRCHTSERICKVLGAKTEEQWRATIKIMGDYDDMKEQTRQTIYSCLSPLPANDPLVCGK